MHERGPTGEFYEKIEAFMCPRCIPGKDIETREFEDFLRFPQDVHSQMTYMHPKGWVDDKG